jgi:hypothetical protein
MTILWKDLEECILMVTLFYDQISSLINNILSDICSTNSIVLKVLTISIQWLHLIVLIWLQLVPLLFRYVQALSVKWEYWRLISIPMIFLDIISDHILIFHESFMTVMSLADKYTDSDTRAPSWALAFTLPLYHAQSYPCMDRPLNTSKDRRVLIGCFVVHFPVVDIWLVVSFRDLKPRDAWSQGYHQMVHFTVGWSMGEYFSGVPSLTFADFISLVVPPFLREVVSLSAICNDWFQGIQTTGTFFRWNRSQNKVSGRRFYLFKNMKDDN